MTWLLVYLCINASGCADHYGVIVNGIPMTNSPDNPFGSNVKLGPYFDTYTSKEECERSSPFLVSDKDHLRMCVTGGLGSAVVLNLRVDGPAP